MEPRAEESAAALPLTHGPHDEAAEVQQTVRQAGAVHQDASQDEEGHRHECEAVHSPVELLGDDAQKPQGVRRPKDTHQTGHQKRRVDRNADDHLPQESEEQEKVVHYSSSFLLGCPK